MKLEITYTRHHYNALDTEHKVILSYKVEEDTQLCTFKMSETALYDMINLLNSTATTSARIRP